MPDIEFKKYWTHWVMVIFIGLCYLSVFVLFIYQLKEKYGK